MECVSVLWNGWILIQWLCYIPLFVLTLISRLCPCTEEYILLCLELWARYPNLMRATLTLGNGTHHSMSHFICGIHHSINHIISHAWNTVLVSFLTYGYKNVCRQADLYRHTHQNFTKVQNTHQRLNCTQNVWMTQPNPAIFLTSTTLSSHKYLPGNKAVPAMQYPFWAKTISQNLRISGGTSCCYFSRGDLFAQPWRLQTPWCKVTKNKTQIHRTFVQPSDNKPHDALCSSSA